MVFSVVQSFRAVQQLVVRLFLIPITLNGRATTIRLSQLLGMFSDSPQDSSNITVATTLLILGLASRTLQLIQWSRHPAKSSLIPSLPIQLLCKYITHLKMGSGAPAQTVRENVITDKCCRFSPVVDGTFLTDFPSALMEQGKFAQVPILIGTTTTERKSPCCLASPTSKDCFSKAILQLS